MGDSICELICLLSSYDGAVDLDAIMDPIERQAVEGMINHFGQTPCQLFKDPHPVRYGLLESLSKTKLPPSLLSFTNHLSCVSVVDLSVETRDCNVFLSIPNMDPLRIRGYGYQTSNSPDVLVTVSRSGCVGLHSWMSHDKHFPGGFLLEKDSTINNPR